MKKRFVLILSVLSVVALSAGCSALNPIPTAQVVQPMRSGNSDSVSEFQPQTVEGGSVTVTAQPLNLKAGAPPEFDIAMNTHSVDLADDLLQAVVLRDDSGKEYAPLAWEGPSAGGHHREGVIRFDPLPIKTKTVTLIVRNVAGIAERVFKWNMP